MVRKRTILIAIFLFAVLVATLAYFRGFGVLKNGFDLPYEVSGEFGFRVVPFAENLGSVTRLEITDDGEYMFVSSLSGEIFIFEKVDGRFDREPRLFYEVDTGVDAFPEGREAGLTGIIPAADFSESRELFLLYSDGLEGGLFNTVQRVRVALDDDGLPYAADRKIIYRGGHPTIEAHQIQGGSSLMLGGHSYIMFAIGDAGRPEDVRNGSLDMGKLVLMDRDGGYEFLGSGIRNSFDTALTDMGGETFVALGDTGPSENDRFILFPLPEQTIDFNWDGTSASLEKPVIVSAADDRVLLRLSPSRTITDILFYEGNGEGIPNYDSSEKYVFMSLFGRTGSTDNDFGRRILFGRISGGSLTTEDFIVRSKHGEGKLGHPLGLDIDPVTGDIFFGDIIEGKIFKVEKIVK
jgi:hypothetical protein